MRKKKLQKKEIPEKIYERYYPDYKQGLSSSQVEKRKLEGLVNFQVDPNFKTTGQIIKENIFTYFNLIFSILSMLLIVVQSYKNLTFLPVIVGNIVIGIVQELRSKKILNNLSVLNGSHIIVVRDGTEYSASIYDLVLDDIVIYTAGDQIPADSKVVFGTIQVNESLLTGESDELTKTADETLMSGSFVVSGKCYAQLQRVGEDSYISKLTAEAKTIKSTEQSEMIKSLNKLVKWVGIIIIPIGMFLFGQSFFIAHNSLKESIVSMEAALLGMIPEGLYLLTTVALALGSMRLAKRKVLLHDMKSIETLARVNTLCVDKTGTITEDKMDVEQLVIPKNDSNSDISYSELEQLISDFSSSMVADNATMETIKSYFNKIPIRVATSTTSFSSIEKFSSATFGETTYILGAPEMVLKSNFSYYENEIAPYMKKGFRVLVFGEYRGILLNKKLTQPVNPLGYIILSNTIRKNAKETFQYFTEQGVSIRVISGDNPITVSQIAMKVNIENAENYIDARTLTNSDEIARALEKYTVFGRVTPEQKKEIIILLKSTGNTVAMTGDGVNDILAMKEADCSVAMASGNDAAIHAAQVVLLDSDFGKMPEVVLEGRRVVNNIERSSSLFLVKNIFSFLMALFAVLFSVTYPLQPSQITLISLFTIGLPSFLLALEKNTQRIEGNFILNVLGKAIPGGVTDMLIVSSLVICGVVLNLTSEDVSTTATFLLIIVGFLVLFKLSRPMNKFRRIIFLSSILGMTLTSILLSNLFSLTKISAISLLLLVILFFTAESLFRLLTNISEKIGLFLEIRKKNRIAGMDNLSLSLRLFLSELKKNN